ncbi:hypothetical protein MCOR27_008555 [Pyricularia oryzae]|uniref:Transcription factor domain-containing protein n=3 Tax=Pyricularia TaxID=48558 RepID=A0ABQ8NAH5_PYRGI|nr:uncharacterized protein MGG_03438 [Pyricularia oryzae 70-15]ELQ40423.1 hypothetical protein OOU_Y34scaffold00437g9 [Pyricularia oryzae Y34]KAH8844080.1 hypothetical protein MCOR01_004858 [Pyricularia oryzae]KAI6293972.1 hypothetical protein MCOR33_008774 [Pyricularia grisea]EHA50174.1 hypothetical protein MGG_03438 [Pyricularia oryzae 70-15]KAH9431601.1 hypothetical protein MCOR02_008891 [Pyricularia oryzae]
MSVAMSSSASAAAAAVKFVGSDADGLPLKRKQVQQACMSCRKKKKRCIHTIPSSPPESKTPLPPSQIPDAPPESSPTRGDDNTVISSSQERLEDDICQVAASQLVELSSRFVGDLNPEGIFVEATTTKASSVPPGPEEIGIWLPTRSESTKTSARSPDVSSRRSRHIPNHYGNGSERRGSLLAAFERARAQYLSEECLVTMPPPQEYSVLRQIFMDKVHPIFPIFTDSDLAGNNPDTVYGDVMKQVISMIGGLDPAGRKNLRLEPGGPLLRPQEFHQQMAEAIFPVLEADWIQNKVDHIRILTTMALFYQPYDTSQKDRARAAWLNTQAVHHLQTLSAHLNGYRPQRPGEDIDRVFCAVWAVDRLCASFYARPTIIHERDVEKDLELAISKQPPCFMLLLKLVQTLDSVFPLYRPHQKFEYTDIPVLESLIMDTGTGRTPTRLLATLETLYHAIAVLSCRQPRSAFSLTSPDDNRSHLPNSTINPRRSLSADRIVWAVQNEDLGPFPFVPYAVSLALTVHYRKMRYSKTVMFRNRGRDMFRNIVAELKKLGDYFFSARINAGLGESILREMEKTATSLCREDGENGSSTVPPIVATASALAALSRNGTPLAAPSGDTRMVDAPSLHAANGGSGIGEAVGANGYHAASGAPISSMTNGSIEPSVFDQLDVDVDLFGFFDPSFNLGAVDTALEANLNMGYPQLWPAETWGLGNI